MATTVNRCKSCIFWQRPVTTTPVTQFRKGTPERGARVCQVRVLVSTITQKDGVAATREIPTWQTHQKNGDPLPLGPKTNQRTSAQDVCKFHRAKVKTIVKPKPEIVQDVQDGLAGYDAGVAVVDELEPAE